MKKCPFCAEEIQDEAIKCRHCDEFLEHSKSEVEVENKLKLFRVYRKGSRSLLSALERDDPEKAIDTVYNDLIKRNVKVSRDDLYAEEAKDQAFEKPLDRGIVVIIVGIIGLITSLSMDTSSGGVNNIGLLNDQQNYVIISSLIILIGFILYIFKPKK